MKLLILFLYPALIFGHKYFAELDEYENPIVPCEEEPDMFLAKYVDYTDLSFVTYENNSLHVQGRIEIIKHVEDVVGLKLEAYKKQRGVFVNTIFSINRQDFCKSLYSPTEYWYPMTKDIAEEERNCPFQEGMFANLNILSDLVFDIPDKSAEGYYKIHLKFYYKQTKEVAMCFNIFANLYRV